MATEVLGNGHAGFLRNVPDSKDLPLNGIAVFSRFCRCGANVTISLDTRAGYIAAEAIWDSVHTGDGHEAIGQSEWVSVSLRRAA